MASPAHESFIRRRIGKSDGSFSSAPATVRKAPRRGHGFPALPRSRASSAGSARGPSRSVSTTPMSGRYWSAALRQAGSQAVDRRRCGVQDTLGVRTAAGELHVGPGFTSRTGREMRSTFHPGAAREEGLKPTEPATSATLVRRVPLDLIGFPPTVAEVDSFTPIAHPTRTKSSSIACSLRPTMVSAGPAAGSTWPVTPTPTATRRIGPLDLALPRLGDPRLERRHAVRPIHDRAVAGDMLPDANVDSRSRDRLSPQHDAQRGRGHRS